MISPATFAEFNSFILFLNFSSKPLESTFNKSANLIVRNIRGVEPPWYPKLKQAQM